MRNPAVDRLHAARNTQHHFNRRRPERFCFHARTPLRFGAEFEYVGRLNVLGGVCLARNGALLSAADPARDAHVLAAARENG
jgi:hypothetical protein